MHANSSFRWFTPALEGYFLSRSNRFLVLVEVGGDVLRCHCPNPGRMTELLSPGVSVLLEAAPEGRATQWSLVAVKHQPLDGSSACIVPLVPGRANQAIAQLWLPKVFPEASFIKPEYKLGHSRFDFMVQSPGFRHTATFNQLEDSPLAAESTREYTKIENHTHLIEVKACSEVEFGSALFPDAPSERASRHLAELGALARSDNYQCHVVLAICHSRPRVFRPNVHTDPEFTNTLAKEHGQLHCHAPVFEVDEDGWTRLLDNDEQNTVPFDLSQASLAKANQGNYLVIMELPKGYQGPVGSLGRVDYPAGWYVYVGSAMANLRQRMARQIKPPGKACHWHLDWIKPESRNRKALPLASWQNHECALAQELENAGGLRLANFGSSDCTCRGHLLWFDHNPERTRAFQAVLMRARHQ